MTVLVVGHHPTCIERTVAVVVHRLDDIYIDVCQCYQRIVKTGCAVDLERITANT